MQELSMNILDVAQNGVAAGAGLVEVALERRPAENRMLLTIRDDGGGMDEETLQKAVDPFFTTRTTRKVGLGLPFLKMAAEMAGGWFSISSAPGRGTEVHAAFALGHIDLAPLGDIGQSIALLAAANPACDVRFTAAVHGGGQNTFTFDSREARGILGGVPFSQPEVMVFVADYVNEHFRALWGPG